MKVQKDIADNLPSLFSGSDHITDNYPTHIFPLPAFPTKPKAILAFVSYLNNFGKQKLLKSKNPQNFVTETFKIGIIKWHYFFDSSNFYLVKLVSQPLLIED